MKYSDIKPNQILVNTTGPTHVSETYVFQKVLKVKVLDMYPQREEIKVRILEEEEDSTWKIGCIAYMSSSLKLFEPVNNTDAYEIH